MRNLLLVFLFSFVASAQTKSTYTLIDDNKSYDWDEQGYEFGMFKVTLSITNGNDKDFYDFNGSTLKVK
jgi:hypothetical protein